MGPLKRERVYARVAVPLILSAMVKAQQLEVVLKAKAFTGRSDRTYLHEARLRGADWVFLLGSLLGFGLLLWLYGAHGVGRFAFWLFA
jgi:energy-coupling factor transport system permease protein